MTVRIGICVLTIVAIVGAARGAVPEKGNNTGKQTTTNGKVTASPAAKQSSAAPVPTKTVATGGAQSQKTPAKTHGAVAKSKSTGVAKESPKAEVPDSPESSEGTMAKSDNAGRITGRRDPFETVIRSQPEGPGCATGKKCLVIDKMDLKGVVRSQNGMIAIITTDQRKTYFLHENDPVYNGHVVKISPDSIVFRETVTDRVGRQSTRDVVKRITRPAA